MRFFLDTDSGVCFNRSMSEKEPIKISTIRLPQSLMTRLQVHRAKKGLKLNDVVTAAIVAYLKAERSV